MRVRLVMALVSLTVAFMSTACGHTASRTSLSIGDLSAITESPPQVSRGSWDEDNAADPRVVTPDLLRHWWTSSAEGKKALKAFRAAGFRRGRVKDWTGVSGDGQANAEVLALLFRDDAGAGNGLHALHDLLRREPPEADERVGDVPADGLGDESWAVRVTGGDETRIYGIRLRNLVIMTSMACVDDAGCSPAGSLSRTAQTYADDIAARGKQALARKGPAQASREAGPLPLVSASGGSGRGRSTIRGTLLFDVTATVPGKYEAVDVSQIYGIGADGTRLRRLTPERALNSAPTWSPDGTTIAYLSYRKGLGTTLWTMNHDGRGKRRLGRYKVSQSPILGNAADYPNFVPRWSTDGKAFLFTRDAPSRVHGSGVDWGKSTIWIVDADGSGAHAVTKNFYVHGLNSSNDVLPSWSPDGRSIAFDRGLALWIARADGTRAHALTGDVGGFQRSEWSPDGKWIAFIGENGSDLFVIRPDGSDERLLTDTGSSDFAWSPDGTRIAVTDCPDIGVAESCRVAVIPIGKERKIAVTKGGPDWVHSWSPDGRAIAFIRPSNSGETLRVVTVEGRSTRQIAKVNNPGGQVGSLVWRPRAR